MPEPFSLTVKYTDGRQEIIEFAMPGQDGKRPRGKDRLKMLRNFSLFIKHIQENIDFKVSGRGWCYQLEQYGFISKGDFPKAQGCINECRKLGYLPIDFVAEDEARAFGGIEQPNKDTPLENLITYLNATEHSYRYYTPDWWEGEEYYLMMLVEKIDLVTLFEPICKEYHMPIANSRGWSSILQRYEIIQLAKKAEDLGLTPVLLYCGDHDPHGLAISDYLIKNIRDLYQATKYWGDNLIIDRFGLNFEFIEETGLSWIDNLETGSGKQADLNDPIVAKYVEQFGMRKCEANALVIDPEAGRDLCRRSIESYLDEGALDRFAEKEEVVREAVEGFLNGSGARELMEQIRTLVEEYEK